MPAAIAVVQPANIAPADSVPQRVLDVCERISKGETFRAVCKDLGLDVGNTWRLINQSEESRLRYAHAREAQAHAMADEIIAISDDGVNDTYRDKEGNVKVDQDHIQRSKLRVESRKWLASKVLPRVYGDQAGQQASTIINVAFLGAASNEQEVQAQVVENQE